MTYNTEMDRPWEDGGDQIVLQKLVPPKVYGRPFEVYFSSPGPGYGLIKFNQSGIQIQPPGRKQESGKGHIVLDGDGDLDFGDVFSVFFSLILSVIMNSLGKLIKSGWQSIQKDEFGIIWQENLENDRIETIGITGRNLTIVHRKRGLRKFTLRAAREDGERLYRELSRHYPQALYTQVE